MIGRRFFIPVACGVVVLLIGAGLAVSRDGGTRIVAYFPSSAGLYRDDFVKVVGVPVGKVTSINPQGDRVRVEMTIHDQPIPANARAAIVSPSLVSGRFVQLAPAYTTGPRMQDGAEIPLKRTAIPVSFDQVKRELTDLSTALGPVTSGIESSPGSLNEAIVTLDANLGKDSARRFKESISAMRKATTELSSGSDDLFATISNLNLFVQNLVENDQALRGLTSGLAEFSDVLDDNKAQLGQALDGLDTALRLIRAFVNDNATSVVESVTQLNALAAIVDDKANSLAGFLHAAPNAINGLYTMMEDQAVTARMTITNVQDLAQLLCGALFGIGGTVEDCRHALTPLIGTLALNLEPASLRPRAAGARTEHGQLPSDIRPNTSAYPSTVQDIVKSLGLGGKP